MSVRVPWDPTELIGAKAGSCTLERLIGRGGASAVFLAKQTRPRREVAVKVLHPRLAPDSSSWDIFLARFRREADAAAALDHANIVPIYEFGDEGDMAYIVMPYLPNGSLGDLLSREGPRPIDVTVHYIEQAAAALDYAHHKGILHRDVKLTNLLLHPDGRVMLTDFGIARPLTSRRTAPPSSSAINNELDAALTQAGGVVGTPEYMAPEQLQGGVLGPTVDVYALATVAWALLAGHTPFGGSSTTEVLTRQLKAPPPPLRVERPDVPARVEEAIMSGLAKDPRWRPATTGGFAQAFRTAAEKSGIKVGRRAALSSLGAAGPSEAYRGPTGDETMVDGSFRGGAPLWPVHAPPSRPMGPSPQRNWLWPVLGLAVIIILVGTTCLTAANWLSQKAPVAQGLLDPIPTASATPIPTQTPTPGDNGNGDSWLSTNTQNLTMSCLLVRTAEIALTNNGSDDVGWNEHQNGSGSFNVSPHDGHLSPGQTTLVTISLQSSKGRSSGEFDFVPDKSAAGPPAVVTYTVVGCLGGG